VAYVTYAIPSNPIMSAVVSPRRHSLPVAVFTKSRPTTPSPDENPDLEQTVPVAVQYIVAAARRAYRKVGFGLSETIYRNMLELELKTCYPRWRVAAEVTVRIFHRRQCLGHGRIDLEVVVTGEATASETWLVELKTGRSPSILTRALDQVQAYARHWEAPPLGDLEGPGLAPLKGVIVLLFESDNHITHAHSVNLDRSA